MAPNFRLLCAALVLCVTYEACEGQTVASTTCNVALDGLVKMQNGYFLAYQIQAGSEESAYDYYYEKGSFKDGIDSLVTATLSCSCKDSWNASCSFRRHFRSRIMDQWFDMDIMRVRLSVYDGKVEKQFIEFDGYGSDETNWFSPSRILSSSYPNFTHESFHYFSIAGSNKDERFLINKFFGNCDEDGGYLVVLDNKTHACPWQRREPTYPTILYSLENTAVNWNNYDSVGTADALAISVYINATCNV